MMLELGNRMPRITWPRSPSTLGDMLACGAGVAGGADSLGACAPQAAVVHPSTAIMILRNRIRPPMNTAALVLSARQ